MNNMFYKATSFNQPLNNWNTGNVIDMDGMFCFTGLFNQPLNNWNTENVTDMNHMFYKAISFNQPLCNQKRKKRAFVETQYLGNNIHLPTELIRHIAGFAFCSWNVKNVSKNTNMFSEATAYEHQKITEIPDTILDEEYASNDSSYDDTYDY